METLPSYTETRAPPAWSEAAISALLTLTESRGRADEEIELIEMRYQQALALMNLEDLFAEGLLGCM
ncbi:MAG: hypothetical protein ACLQT5_08990 [Steroidobacteraceae bacterium]|jgi:hypothetical protein